MNWQKEAEGKLRCYTAKATSLQNIPQTMSCLKMMAAGIRSATADGEPVTGGGSGREDAILTNIVKRDELERAYSIAKKQVDTIDRALAVLDNEARRILEVLYINNERDGVGKLMKERSLSQSEVYRRRDNALRTFTMALYGVLET